MSKKDEALKLALEALEFYCDQHGEESDAKAIAAIREALAEQPAQQEPYCYTYTENGEEYFAPPTAYVPDDAKPLYTSPPASKPWVGLTQQEHTDIAIQCGCMSADLVFYGATVERILKEKNS